MGVAGLRGLVLIVAGAWSVAACVPPTPKVEPSLITQVLEKTSRQITIRIAHSCLWLEEECSRGDWPVRIPPNL